MEYADLIEMDPLPYIGHEIIPAVSSVAKIFSHTNSHDNVKYHQTLLNSQKKTASAFNMKLFSNEIMKMSSAEHKSTD